MTKILIIEDDTLLLETLAELLKSAGFEVLTATDGKSGIKLAKGQLPDLIVSDVNMPVLTGHDVLAELQTDPVTSNIPFIFLSGLVDMKEMRKGMQMGADDYIPKPVDPHELISAVRTRLEKQRKVKRYYEEQIIRTRHDLEMTRNFDAVTQLPKQSVLAKDIENLRKTAHGESLAGMMIIHIRRLREVIDIIGNRESEQIIRMLVDRFRTVLRDDQRLYWLDNDRFGLLLTAPGNKQSMASLAKKLIQKIRQNLELDGQELRFSASIGISVEKLVDCDFKTMLSDTELALKFALEQEFNNYKFYDPRIKKHVFDQLRLESALHRAVERNEFLMHYQPKIRLADEKIVGVEALVRWKNEALGTVSPSQFIPIAENNGLIIKIGEWINHEICSQVSAWKKQGVDIPRVAVNVSGGQIEAANFVEKMENTLKNNNISGEAMEIELTESILVREAKQTAVKLGKVKEMGISISIDDFGTGYSSLQYLKNFPHDKIKIDRSFIRDLATDTHSASIVKTIIAMAHQLGVKVVAEGVETLSQIAFLKEHRCDEIQGYLYSRPVAAKSIPDLIRETPRLFNA